LLLNLLGKVEEHRSIVFINTKAMAERVTRALERQGHRVATLSGDVPQAKRERLLARFQKGDIELLVATDVAARGLHIPAVSHVFNFDLPQDAEDYVHRIGRTARLGAEGDAISFACDRYAMGLPDIEAYIEQKIPTASVSADMLVVPPAKPRADGRPFVDDEAEAADDARNTAGAPPKDTKSRQSGSRTGTSRSAGRDSGRAPRRSESRPVGPAAPRAVKSEVKTAEPAASAPAAAGTLDPAKKRRRRGGRGRNKSASGEALSAATAARDQATAAPEGQKRERKPRREHPSTIPTADTARPSSAAAKPEHATPKPGFLRRIASLFTAR
jgi:ATP-dependent RNA helicase RhlB